MTAPDSAEPSTCIELVRRLTEHEDTPSTFKTAFSTRALHAAQLMPVTLYCFIDSSHPGLEGAALRPAFPLDWVFLLPGSAADLPCLLLCVCQKRTLRLTGKRTDMALSPGSRWRGQLPPRALGVPVSYTRIGYLSMPGGKFLKTFSSLIGRPAALGARAFRFSIKARIFRILCGHTGGNRGLQGQQRTSTPSRAAA